MRELVWSIVEDIAEEHINLFPHHCPQPVLEIDDEILTVIKRLIEIDVCFVPMFMFVLILTLTHNAQVLNRSYLYYQQYTWSIHR